MSNTNYDVELPIIYNNTYRHYIPSYRIAVPYYTTKKYWTGTPGNYYQIDLSFYETAVSFDAGNETTVTYAYKPATRNTVWNTDNFSPYDFTPALEVPDTGVFSKIYFRNPNRNLITFTSGNCHVEPIYSIKAAFEIQFNSVGFAANSNASFKCSTIPKNTYAQYEWTEATVYYKKTTDQNYTSVSGTVSGSWSDITVSTNISLSDSYTYDVYITATADDGSTASTEVAQFNTVDAAAIATCISPVGAFTQGDITFVWSHATAYGTPQYAYDLQYSNNNGSSWTTVKSHEVTQNNTTSITLTDAGVYLWRVKTYNSNDVAGDWAQATFVNNMPASPPTNLRVNTKGRPTVEWASVSQTAYQVQFLLNDNVVYDSGAIYTSETSHFVNYYFNDSRSYVVRVRIYNALGEISGWTETGYQQPSIEDVVFTIDQDVTGGAIITITPSDTFSKYYILRNDKPIAKINGTTYTDKYAAGQVNYSVVGVTSADQSDIQTKGFKVIYPHATVITQEGQYIEINKRYESAWEIQTSNEADINKANYIGDDKPTHYPSKMRLKSFTVSCWDDQGITEDILGTMVFYADNFGNGGYCMVTSYDKTDSFIKNSQGTYANEVSLLLEVTNYDDSIEYPI